MNTREKILSREGLHGVFEEHRRSGRKIVFANGVFDLLHAGHVRYLEAARREGDVLVVGVNSDASARKLKGDGRPVLTERARASLVAALAAVDHVIIFGELERPGAAPRIPAGRPCQGNRLCAGHRAGARAGGASRHSRRHRRRSQAALDARTPGPTPPAERWLTRDFCSSGSARWATSSTPFRRLPRFAILFEGRGLTGRSSGDGPDC